MQYIPPINWHTFTAETFTTHAHTYVNPAALAALCARVSGFVLQALQPLHLRACWGSTRRTRGAIVMARCLKHTKAKTEEPPRKCGFIMPTSVRRVAPALYKTRKGKTRGACRFGHVFQVPAAILCLVPETHKAE